LQPIACQSSIYIHICSHGKECLQLWEKLGRLGKKKFGDIDFVSYGKSRGKVVKFFENRGYIIDRRMLYRFGKKRHIYIGEKFPMVDVFFDTIDMCHLINLKKRLEVDHPTIPLAELVLHKLQIVKMNEKDITDLIVLIRAHDVGETDEETINAKYIAKLLSNDWGFWYTATTNLSKIKKCVDKLEEFGPKVGIDPELISEEKRADISNKTAKLLAYINKEKKPMKWKLRSKIGTTKKWYKHVETPEAVSGFGIWHAKEIFPEKD
jgi:hypothetical protein